MALFKDLLKKWFYTNSSQAASSDARVPLLDASGNPKGSDTMANIATVLGVLQNNGTTINDCNLAPSNMAVYVQVNAQNFPTQLSSSSGFVYTIANLAGHNDNFKSQIFWSYGTNRVFFRCQNDSAWSSWEEYCFDYPSFYKNYANLSSLAAALGGLQVISSSTLANGFNTDVRYNYIATTTGGSEGWPFDVAAGGGYLVQFYVGEGLALQIAVATAGSDAAIRTKWFRSNFNAWRRFTLTSM